MTVLHGKVKNKKMNFTNLNIEQLELAVNHFNISTVDTYISSYQQFIKYFNVIDKIEKHHLIISSHFVYGWMPTILNLNQSKNEKVIELLNKAKVGHDFSVSQLEILKQCINNSLCGTSKLLHFIKPDYYAIWDSRVLKFITGNSSIYGINKVENYIQYLEQMKKLENDSRFQNLFNKIQEKFEYKITSLRAIEVLMFVSNKNGG